MFAKLLKHEWRAIRSVIGLLCVIILLAGLTIGGVANYMFHMDQDGPTVVLDEDEQAMYAEPELSEFTEVVCVLLIVAGVMAVAVCAAASIFVVIWRFYKSRFTDEGYLTFTLPVNSHQLLLSSILNSIFGVLLVILACFAAVGIAFALVFLAFPQDIIWADVWVRWESVRQQLWESFVKNADQFALAAFSGITGAVSQLLSLMLAVTIGSLLVKKHKIFAAVGVYYGIGLVESFLYSSIFLAAAAGQSANLLLGLPGVVALILAVGSYFLMYWLTSKRLNLN